MSEAISDDRGRPGDPEPSTDLLRLLPQVEKVLRFPVIESLAAEGPRGEVAEAVRGVLDEARQEILRGGASRGDLEGRLSPEGIAAKVRKVIERRKLSAYRRVVNATGIILHTGLGRAVIAPSAIESLSWAISGYSLVELDLETGERNQREDSAVALLTELTGAESGTVVNNNAAATLLILAALARGKEVVISRGQLVEIGGAFRLPEILHESGARLVEVGTTNRTYISDYRRALSPETALLLQVHTSNYEMQGFVHHTPLEELVALGREKGIPVVSDLGSGCFVDLSPHGFKPEPLVSSRVEGGADLVCFSGDKLLGGPQAGIIVGKAEHVRTLRAHPLFRPLRVDKTTLILLEATLRAYRDPERIWDAIPTLRAIREPVQSVRRRAIACLDRARVLGVELDMELLPSAAQAGSGSLPAQEIPSAALALRHRTIPARELALRLRLGSPPVISRLAGDRVWLDFRTVLPGEEEILAAALITACAATDPG